MKSVWLTWERQTRNKSMADLLGAEYCELISPYKGWRRYLQLSWKTLRLVAHQKPDVIFFQNPSIVLSLLCTVLKIIRRNIFTVADFHNCALDKKKFYALNKFISRKASLTLVTNRPLSYLVEEMGGNPFIFPDPIPSAHYTQNDATQNCNHRKFILFISSWADDEPIDQVCEAFINSELKNEGIALIITGKIKANKLSKPAEIYANHNVEFAGFVPEDNYWELLRSSIFNIDLTTRDDCMVCGAYESLSVHNTVLLSNNQPTMDYFKDAALYTDNSVLDLTEKLKILYQNHLVYKAQAEKMLVELQAEEQRKANELLKRARAK